MLLLFNIFQYFWAISVLENINDKEQRMDDKIEWNSLWKAILMSLRHLRTGTLYFFIVVFKNLYFFLCFLQLGWTSQKQKFPIYLEQSRLEGKFSIKFKFLMLFGFWDCISFLDKVSTLPSQEDELCFALWWFSWVSRIFILNRTQLLRPIWEHSFLLLSDSNLPFHWYILIRSHLLFNGSFP